jgi:hypothetical protein
VVRPCIDLTLGAAKRALAAHPFAHFQLAYTPTANAHTQRRTCREQVQVKHATILSIRSQCHERVDQRLRNTLGQDEQALV